MKGPQDVDRVTRAQLVLNGRDAQAGMAFCQPSRLP